MLTGVFGLVSTMATLGSFADSCYNDIIDTTYYDLAPGAGLILAAVATLLKLIDVICHVLLLTPPHRWGEAPTATDKTDEKISEMENPATQHMERNPDASIQ